MLVLGIIGVYWPVAGYGFTFLDDPDYVWLNPHVASGLSWSGVAWAFTSFDYSNWHPLTWLSHMLDVQLFGMRAGWHHAVNVLFHAANTVLLFLLLKRLMGLRRDDPTQLSDSPSQNVNKATSATATATAPQAGALWRSAFVAALFGFHPLHVESVAWIAERKDVLSTFFFMLTLMAYTRYAQKRSLALDARPSTLDYALALLFFALGLMSKPMLVTLPFVLLLLDYWPLGRVTGDRWRVTRLILEKIPFFVLSAGSCVVTYLAQAHGGAVKAISVLPFDVRIQNALLSYALYLKNMVWPTSLAVYYPYVPVEPASVATAIFLLLLISGGVMFFLGRRPYLLVGWLWFLGTLVPVIGLVQVGAQAMADRYTYVPLIGVFIGITWGVGDALEGWRYRRGVMAVVSVGVLAVCLRLTATQVRYWQNTETLIRHDLAVTPDNPDMQVLLGNALLDEGKPGEAGHHFSDALRIQPNNLYAQSGLASAIADQGYRDEAIEACRAAIAINPHEAKPHYMLAGLLLRQGNFAAAIVEYQMTLQIEPNHPLALNDFAWLLATAPDARFRNGAEAVGRAEQACRVTGYEMPLFVGTLAAAYAEAGRFDDAVKTAQQAMNLATAQKKAALADKNRELLKLYRDGKAYHEPTVH